MYDGANLSISKNGVHLIETTMNKPNNNNNRVGIESWP